jgi:hypothetical protein
MITARRATALLLTAAAALGLMALLLMPNPGIAAHATPTPASASLAAQAAPATSGGTGVSAELDARAAFLADLTDGAATDLDPATADDLVADAHRICDLHQPRADWLAALTAPGPHALTEGEATKLIDTAEAAFCPAELSASRA